MTDTVAPGTTTPSDPFDPKGLIRESYRIEAVTMAECRSIFLDWALTLPEGSDQKTALRTLLDRYGADAGHPMTQVLTEATEKTATAKRRGGWRARRGVVPAN